MELKINYSMINILKYKDAILSFFLNIIDLFRLCNCILRSGWGSNSLCKFCKLAGRHDQPDHCASGRTRTYTIAVLETSWLNQLPTLACIHLERLELSLIWYVFRNFTNWATVSERGKLKTPQRGEKPPTPCAVFVWWEQEDSNLWSRSWRFTVSWNCRYPMLCSIKTRT